MKRFLNILLHIIAYGMLIGAIVLVHYDKVHEPKNIPCQANNR